MAYKNAAGIHAVSLIGLKPYASAGTPLDHAERRRLQAQGRRR